MIDLILRKFSIGHQSKSKGARSERPNNLVFLKLSPYLEDKFYKFIIVENRPLNHLKNY